MIQFFLKTIINFYNLFEITSIYAKIENFLFLLKNIIAKKIR